MTYRFLQKLSVGISTLLAERHNQHARSQALPGNALSSRLRLPRPPVRSSRTQAEPPIHLVPRQSLGTRWWRSARSVGLSSLLLTLTLALTMTTELFAKEPIPEKVVVLTFDDSAKSHYSIVRPMLLEYGFGGTFFITEGFDFKENKKDYMTWEEIEQLDRDGFEIGNHTRDHLGFKDENADKVAEQLKAIDDRCQEHKIPKPVSFSWPGNSLSKNAIAKLSEHGIKFARRGGAPEYDYDRGKGFAYEPYLDHPLLLPSAGDARPDWEMEDFVRAVEQAKYGRIAVLQFHGVPDTAHSWVNTPKAKFEQYMRYLAVNGYKVIAMRDLEKYVDPSIHPTDPWGVIEDRKSILKKEAAYNEFRKPKSDDDLKFWLSNMLIEHHYTSVEASAATGLSVEDIQAAVKRLNIEKGVELEKDLIRVLPFPGGRHPRVGFRDGAIRPQRETKLSIFIPWQSESYVVADVPEAIWWMQQDRRELLYLAHTHVKTTWDMKGVNLEPLEWQRTAKGWKMERTLPNGVVFGAEAEALQSEIQFNLWVRNGSSETLKGMMVQNCVMLAGAAGFDSLTTNNKVIEKPFVACHDESKRRWIVTAWQSCARPWANPPCPCMHSDPQFPDCPAGETVKLRGVLSFYEGEDIRAEFTRLMPWIDAK